MKAKWGYPDKTSSEHALPQTLIEGTSHWHTSQKRNIMISGGKSEMQNGMEHKENERKMWEI